ncbi:hypothetical protein G3576_25710 [Roseomonas stagni]|uniref:Uncharacterized protein n=1 Tax=Falsiroseomonas algicola TaxID=2716930 RepID=A0A6M1LSJ7_9PROT|nr:hypothetical protein [Falsiroseomonas algicola]NGM23435.1 hypothetical protein [Falsiroseomonas algicola]
MLAMTAGLGACAEMRTPAPITRIPPVLAAGSADPVLDLVNQAATDFEDAGRSLANDPARMARAAARVEVISAEFARDARWAPLSPSVGFEMRGARTELRAALGIRAGASPEAASRALSAAYAALMRGDRAAAVRALDPAIFEPGGEGTLAFLTRPGPLPQSRIATALARDEASRLARSNVWGLSGSLDPDSGWLDPLPGRGMSIGPR